MKIRKMLPVLLLAMLLATSAWADNIPEFDAVGVDSANFFAANMITYQVVTGYWGEAAKNLEDFSNFVGIEKFYQTIASMLKGDPSESPTSTFSPVWTCDLGLSEVAGDGTSPCSEVSSPSAEGAAVVPTVLCSWLAFGKIPLRKKGLLFTTKTPRTTRTPITRKLTRNI